MNTHAGLLPEHAREALMTAAQTPISVRDPNARLRAIDQTVERLRQQYPDYFREEHLVEKEAA